MDLFKLMFTVELLQMAVFFVLKFCWRGNSAEEHSSRFFLREIDLILLFTTLKLNLAIASKKSLIIKVVRKVIRDPWIQLLFSINLMWIIVFLSQAKVAVELKVQHNTNIIKSRLTKI